MTLYDKILTQRVYPRKKKTMLECQADLEKMRELDRYFGFPTKSFRSILVTGTNGKGSVSYKIAEGLEKMGYKTGLYTSPHISTYLERIQINQTFIEERVMENLVSQVVSKEEILSFFQILTLVAFLYFSLEKVDFAVLECGIGGRFDPTNIVQPELSVITSIHFDHEELLGHTLEDIGNNKAGIFRPHVPAVIGHKAYTRAVVKEAFLGFSPLTIVPPIEDWIEENECIAKAALKVLFPLFMHMRLKSSPPCRFEEHSWGNLDHVFDIGHNIEALSNLFLQMEKRYPSRRIWLIFTMSRDKNTEEALNLIREKVHQIFFFRSKNPRLLMPEEWQEKGYEGDIYSFIQEAKGDKGVVLITGSAHFMHEAKEVITRPLSQYA